MQLFFSKNVNTAIFLYLFFKISVLINKIPNNCFHELILTEEKLKEKITNLIN